MESISTVWSTLNIESPGFGDRMPSQAQLRSIAALCKQKLKKLIIRCDPVVAISTYHFQPLVAASQGIRALTIRFIDPEKNGRDPFNRTMLPAWAFSNVARMDISGIRSRLAAALIANARHSLRHLVLDHHLLADTDGCNLKVMDKLESLSLKVTSRYRPSGPDSVGPGSIDLSPKPTPPPYRLTPFRQQSSIWYPTSRA